MSPLGIANGHQQRYGLPVAANSATGFGDPSNLAHKRPIRKQALFLCPQLRVMAAVRGIPSGMPGSKFPVRQPAYSCHPKSFGDDSWQLQTKLGATPMRTTLSINPSKSHADAWKARAFAALRANSSLSVRLRRYNEAMARARQLEGRLHTPDSGYLNVPQDHICTDRASSAGGVQ